MQYHTHHTSSLYYYHQTQNKSVFSLLFLLSVLFCVARFNVFLTSNVIKHISIIIFLKIYESNTFSFNSFHDIKHTRIIMF